MLHPESLIKKTEGWQFASEADLEDFVWNNLEKLFGLSLLGTGQLKRDRRICVFLVSMKWAFQHISLIS